MKKLASKNTRKRGISLPAFGPVSDGGGSQKMIVVLEKMLASNPGPNPPRQALKITAQKKSELGMAGNILRNRAVTIVATATNRTAAKYATITDWQLRQDHSDFICTDSSLHFHYALIRRKIKALVKIPATAAGACRWPVENPISSPTVPSAARRAGSNWPPKRECRQRQFPF